MLFIAVALAFNAEAKQFVVVIDPGHGGKDYGAIGSTTNEKTINLNVARKLGEKIKKKYGEEEVKVVFTRNRDVFIALNDRARIANDAKGDLFISIHVNSLDKRNKNRASIAGTEVYTCGLHRSESNLAVAKRENAVMYLEEDYTQKYQGFDPNSPESYIAFELNQSKHLDRSIEFATLAKDYLTTTAKRRDKGVKQAGFWVLWSTSMPSVLVELDFISNPTSEKFMASADGVEKMSKSLFQAFDDYYATVNGSHVGRRDDAAPGDSTQPSRDTAEGKVSTAGDRADYDEGHVSTDDNITTSCGGIEYRVQVLANDRSMSLKSKSFKGETVSEYYDRGMYKYTVGNYPTQAEADKALRRLKRKFPGAFVIKMENGKRIY